MSGESESTSIFLPFESPQLFYHHDRMSPHLQFSANIPRPASTAPFSHSELYLLSIVRFIFFIPVSNHAAPTRPYVLMIPELRTSRLTSLLFALLDFSTFSTLSFPLPPYFSTSTGDLTRRILKSSAFVRITGLSRKYCNSLGVLLNGTYGYLPR